MTRRFRPARRRSTAFWLALLALIAFRVWQDWRQPPEPARLEEGAYQVARVIDGDTLQLANQQTIRLLAVDTPETVKPEHPVESWGREATQFTRHFVAGGTMRLQFDRDRVDRFGRLLAYVWVGQQMLNEELLRAGLARFESQYNNSPSIKQRFRRAQQEAKDHARGIWSRDPAIPAAAHRSQHAPTQALARVFRILPSYSKSLHHLARASRRALSATCDHQNWLLESAV